MKKRIISILSMLVLICFLLVGAPTSMTAKAAADPAFTKQPVGGEVLLGEKLTVSWKLNFTPTQQRVVRLVQDSDERRCNLCGAVRSFQ